MKRIVFSLCTFIALALISTPTLLAQKMDKAYKTVVASRVINQPADKVWALIGEDYGYIANTHPGIYYSNYEAGSVVGELNAQRVCNLNEKGTKVLHEQITNWDPINMTMTNRILEVGGLPLDPDNSLGVYSVIPIDEHTSELKMVFDFRTKPAFMGLMAKGKFKKLLANFLLGVQHHMATGEIITNETDMKALRKLYDSEATTTDQPTACR